MPSQVPSVKPRRDEGVNSSWSVSRSASFLRSSLVVLPATVIEQPHSAIRIAAVHTEGSDLRNGTHDLPWLIVPQLLHPRRKLSVIVFLPLTRQSFTSCFAAPFEFTAWSMRNSG